MYKFRQLAKTRPTSIGQNFLVHPVYLEPEVTGGWYSGLLNIIGCTLCVLRMKTIGSDSFFDYVISHGMTHCNTVIRMYFLIYSILKAIYIAEREVIKYFWYHLSINIFLVSNYCLIYVDKLVLFSKQKIAQAYTGDRGM